ncbi:MAG: GNAT family N-acetyltransferase [Gemmatimonadetes bacterium]|nr:GNAT family N-acetyltransferase [Gemmatimonadota bacterium]
MPDTVQIQLAASDDEIAACHAVMHQLRPHVPAEGFVARIRRMEAQRFRLAYARHENGAVSTVAGFRILEQLGSGQVLYVDDLVTDQEVRSRGDGAAMLAWLEAYAREHECDYLELDSGVWRADAHRFYFRRGLTILGFHFRTAPLRTSAPILRPA